MLFQRSTAQLVATVVIVVFMSLILLYQARERGPMWNSSRFPNASRPKDRLFVDITNNTLGFEKILVVGMPSRTDRRDGMTLQAALSNMEIEFIDSSDGTDIPDKALPNMDGHERLPGPVIGSWRGHVNAIREVVRRNLTSALIMEDDTDWDIRVRQQLQNFARSSRALTQPLQGYARSYGDPTYGLPPGQKDTHSPLPSLPELVIKDMDHLPITTDPKISPYGDDWDVLWLGHCGQLLPKLDDKNVPKGRVVQQNDETAAQRRYLHSVLKPFQYVEEYPDHARVVHHVQDGVCSLAYAVSQRGARSMLYEIGMKNFNAAFDLLLHWACSGENGRDYHRCLTVQPPLIQHHRPAGPKSAQSDISGHGEGMNEKPHTEEIRWSVRMNAEVLMVGGTDYVDQYPDE